MYHLHLKFKHYLDRLRAPDFLLGFLFCTPLETPIVRPRFCPQNFTPSAPKVSIYASGRISDNRECRTLPPLDIFLPDSSPSRTISLPPPPVVKARMWKRTPGPNRFISINFVHVNARSLYTLDWRIVVVEGGGEFVWEGEKCPAEYVRGNKF